MITSGSSENGKTGPLRVGVMDIDPVRGGRGGSSGVYVRPGRNNLWLRAPSRAFELQTPPMPYEGGTFRKALSTYCKVQQASAFLRTSYSGAIQLGAREPNAALHSHALCALISRNSGGKKKYSNASESVTLSRSVFAVSTGYNYASHIFQKAFLAVITVTTLCS